MTLLQWVQNTLAATERERRRIKTAILEGIRNYNASWEKTDPKDELDAGYKLSKRHPLGENLYRQLTSSEVDFIGFAPDVTYIKEKGSRENMEVIWKHDFGTPALLYKHKKLPLLLIAGPSIRFNKSALSEIDANDQQSLLSGITG